MRWFAFAEILWNNSTLQKVYIEFNGYIIYVTSLPQGYIKFLNNPVFKIKKKGTIKKCIKRVDKNKTCQYILKLETNLINLKFNY